MERLQFEKDLSTDKYSEEVLEKIIVQRIEGHGLVQARVKVPEKDNVSDELITRDKIPFIFFR